MVLTSISAFEGFVEEFTALVAGHQNQSYGQIAKLVSMNNPTVRTFDAKLRQALSWGDGMSWKTGFSVTVWDPPAVSASSSWIGRQSLSWSDAETQAEGWMQVRHCLTHGLARGFRPEIWPGPLKGPSPPPAFFAHEAAASTRSLSTAQSRVRTSTVRVPSGSQTKRRAS